MIQRKTKDYESMTNRQLLAEAKRKGMIVSPAWHNRLSVIRMVRDDRLGEADRHAFIERLRSFDNQHTARTSMIVAVLSLIAAIASICISVLLGRN